MSVPWDLTARDAKNISDIPEEWKFLFFVKARKEKIRGERETVII